MNENAMTSSAFPPSIFRVMTVSWEACRPGYTMTARIFHSRARFTISWHASHPDTRIREGVLIRVLWKMPPTSGAGVISIARAVVLGRPTRSGNLFLTVPPSWVTDRALIERAALLWEGMHPLFQELFNVVFWDSDRLLRFCRAPSSMAGHHSVVSGNLRHSVDMAEVTLSLRNLVPTAHLGVATFAALLHDAGKADEYEPSQSGRWRLTDRGELLGHKCTIIEWLATARGKMRHGFPESLYLSLLHALTAVVNAPEWTGLRRPVTPEAILLSMVDRASGQGDLLSRQQATNGGWVFRLIES